MKAFIFPIDKYSIQIKISMFILLVEILECLNYVLKITALLKSEFKCEYECECFEICLVTFRTYITQINKRTKNIIV